MKPIQTQDVPRGPLAAGRAPEALALADMTVAVFGGAGAWGARLVETFRGRVARLIVVDPAAPDGADPAQAWASCDAAFVAVFPDDRAAQAIRDGIPHLRPGTAVIDLAGAKEVVRPALEAAAAAGASVCSAHPLVHPKSTVQGHNAPMIDVGAAPALASRIARETFGTLLGMRAAPCTFQEHAEALLCNQALPHATMRASLRALADEVRSGRATPDFLRALTSANAWLFELGMARVAIQRGDISQNLIEEGMRLPHGKALLAPFLAGFAAGLATRQDDPGALGRAFDADVAVLDPDGSWRGKMRQVTDHHVGELVREA